mgnify:CR=1 FL=1
MFTFFIFLLTFLLVSKNIKGLVLITGTTSGVGLNTLKPLLRFGWEVIAVNKVDLPEVKGNQSNLMRELEQLTREVFFISAITGEGVAALMDSVASKVGPEKRSKKEDASKIEVIIPKPRGEPIKILKEENTFIVRSSRAERIVNRANLDDWQVQAQILAEFKKMGVIRALEKAGIKEGAMVRVGGWELEWN